MRCLRDRWHEECRRPPPCSVGQATGRWRWWWALRQQPRTPARRWGDGGSAARSRACGGSRIGGGAHRKTSTTSLHIRNMSWQHGAGQRSDGTLGLVRAHGYQASIGMCAGRFSMGPSGSQPHVQTHGGNKVVFLANDGCSEPTDSGCGPTVIIDQQATVAGQSTAAVGQPTAVVGQPMAVAPTNGGCTPTVVGQPTVIGLKLFNRKNSCSLKRLDVSTDRIA